MTVEGLMTFSSQHDPKATTERAIAAIAARGMTVMARIDHAAAAAVVGMELRATEVVIFGNPKGGTPLMQAAQTMGIDLPLKILVWRDEHDQTWLAYNDPFWLARRHGVANAEAALSAMAGALAAIAEAASTGSATK